MNKTNEAKLNMYGSVQKLCNDNQTTVATLPAFAAAFSELETILDDLRAAVGRQSGEITGFTADKAVARDVLQDMCEETAGAIAAWAMTTGNNALRVRMGFVPSDLDRMRDEDLAPFAQEIHSEGTANLAALSGYGVDAAKLALLQNQIDTYSGLINAPRVASVNRSADLIAIANLIKDGDLLLAGRMDLLARQFRGSDPGFYEKYQRSRRILNAATHHTGILVEVKSALGAIIKGAVVSIPELEMSITSDDNGQSLFRPVSMGSYQVSVSAPGFKPKFEEGIQTVLGKTTTFVIIIEE